MLVFRRGVRLADGAQGGVALVEPVDGNVLEVECVDDLIAPWSSAAIQQKRKSVGQRRRSCQHVLLRSGLISRFEEPHCKLIVGRDYWSVEFRRLGMVFYVR